MATFIYETHDVQDFKSLLMALSEQGITGAEITLGDVLTIIHGSAMQSQVDTAVSSAASGGFISEKTKKIEQVKSKTLTLTYEGVAGFDGEKLALSKADADNYIVDFEYYSKHPEKLSINTPYAIANKSGGISSTSELFDIETLSNDAVDRMIYLYTAVLNGDGSKGQAQLLLEIDACTTQEQLDSITDTRS